MDDRHNQDKNSTDGAEHPLYSETLGFSQHELDEIRKMLEEPTYEEPSVTPAATETENIETAEPPHREAEPAARRDKKRASREAAVETDAEDYLAQTAETAEADKEKFNMTRELFDWAQALVTSIILVGVVFAFFARIIGVSGPSMQPTLYENQKLLISSLFYTPKKGDVVIFTKKNIHLALQNAPKDEPLVKRVIATAGQTVNVDIEERAVYVDNVRLEEDYIKELTYTKDDVTFPVTVPEGCVFVMGDNRNDSIDSRSSKVGMVDTRYILGKVLLRVWPLDLAGPVR